MDGASIALQSAIYINIPLMGFVAAMLWNINQRLTVVETTVKHIEQRLTALERE